MNFFKLLKKGIKATLDYVIFGKTRFFLFFRKLVKEQHQLTSVTASNRYPELFDEARSVVQVGTQNLSILSFGCSTGEECFTMESYFPKATIIGLDINKSNLRKAIKSNKHANIKFLFSTPETIVQHGKYDLIFCLSVLCRWEDTKDLANCEHIYPFIKFSETIKMLADQIKSGGSLIVYNSNFRFEDTTAFQDFEIVPTPSVNDSGFVHKFDSNNNRITSEHRHCIYRKR